MKISIQALTSPSQTSSFNKVLRRVAFRVAPEIAYRALATVMAFFTLFGFNPQALASTQTWASSGASTAWSSTTNWAGNPPPGSVTSSTSTDLAVFNSAVGAVGTSLNPIVIDQTTQNIGGITFNGAAGGFTIGNSAGNSLFLTNGGTIQVTALTGPANAIETINAPLVIAGGTTATTTYTLANGSTSGSGSGSGTLVIGGPISVGAVGPAVLNINGANTNYNTITGNISNGQATSFGITKSGAGTWLLSGSNSYAGATTISAGVLDFGAENALYGDVTSSWSGANLFVVSGATLALQLGSSSPLFTGSDIDTLLANMASTSSNASGFENGSQLGLDTNNSGGSFTYSGVIANPYATGTMGITKLGAGTLTLAGASTYSGPTIISSGTLQAGVASVTNISGALGLNSQVSIANSANAALNITGFNTQIGSLTGGGATGGNVILGGATLTIGGNNTNATYAGVISGSGGGIAKIGTGVQTLSGSNTYSGTTTISQGVLDFANESSLYTGGTNNWVGSNIIVQNGGTLGLVVGAVAPQFTLADIGTLLGQMKATSSGTSGFESGSSLGIDTSTVGAFNYANPLTDAYAGGDFGITKLGSGTLVLSGSNNYTGVTTINAGTLKFANESSLYNDVTANWTASNIIVKSGGTLALVVGSASPLFTNADIGTLLGNLDSGSSATSGFEAGSSFGIDTTNASGGIFTYGGVIANGFAGGTMGLTKLGLGTLLLNGATANTYTGPTSVLGGTLQENFSGSITSNLINPTSALILGGGALTVNAASLATSQSFASTTLNAGPDMVTASNGSSTSGTIALGAITATAGATVEYVGPAYNNGASSAGIVGGNPVPATGTITTTSAGTGTLGLFGGTSAIGDYATVNLYDWATTDLPAGTAGTSPFTIIGGSQVTGFYISLAGGTTAAAANYDVTGNSSSPTTTTTNANSLRFNTNAAVTFAVNNGQSNQTGKNFVLGGILVTPNVGSFNTTITSGDGLGLENNSANSLVIWQNNTSGELLLTLNAGSTNSFIKGTGNYIQAGPGTVVDAAFNSYTGQTYLNGGVTQISADGALGGTGTSNVNLNGGTLLGNYTGSLDAGSSATAHPVVLGGNGGGLAATAGNTLTVDGLISGGTGTGPLIIGIPASSANGNTAGLVPGTGTNTANTIAVNATGTVVLSNASNSYVNGTILDSGVLQLPSGGTTANLGTGGVTFNGGTFQWSSNTSDISPLGVTLAAGGGTFDTNGNNVTFGNPIGNGGSGALTVKDTAGMGSLTLNGNNTFSGAVTVNPGATLKLGGANVYTGNTTINGTLTLKPASSLANTAITVGNGGTLNTTGNTIGTNGASLVLQGGALLSMENNAIETLTLNSTVAGGSGTVLSVGGNSSTASLDFDLNSTSSDQLVVNNGVTAFGVIGGKIFINDLDNLSPLSTYTLISDPNGGLAVGTSPGSWFQLGTTSLSINGNTYVLSLANSTSTAVLLTLSAASVNYYWTGAANSSWSGIGNFATDHIGATAQTAIPGISANVFLTADSAANYSQTLDGNYTINSLSFTGSGTGAASNSVTLDPGTGTTLTINAANGFSDSASNTYTAGVGLVVQPGSGAHTISANIDLANSQIWKINNSSANPLTVSGIIADGSSLDSLTLSGSGMLILSGANTYDGGTILTGGTLMLAPTGSLAPGGALTVGGTSTFDLGANIQTISGLSDGGSSASTIIASIGAGVLTINNSTPSVFSGTITDNNASNASSSLALVLEGSSNVTLSGSNNFTAGVSIVGGNLIAANNFALGSGTSQNASAGLNFNNAGTANVSFTSANPMLAAINEPSATGSANIILGNASGSGSATTLNVGGNGGNSVFNGTISDLSSTKAAAIGNLIVDGGGFLTLGGANTFTGTVVLTGSGAFGLSEIEVNNALALENATLNYNNQGGFIAFGSITAATLGGLTGAENLALTTVNLTPITLSIGNNNVNSAYTGNLGGVGGVTKVGSGSFQVGSGAAGGASYAGSTVVSQGTLIIGGTGTLTGGVSVNQGTLIVQDDAVINSNSTLLLNNLTGNPAPANLTVSGTATVIVSGFSFGSNTRANGVVTIQNLASLIDNGSYDFLNDLGGTTATATTTTNVTGGMLAVQNFILVNAGNSANTATALNIGGGTIEALANDPSASSFLPALAKLTVKILAGGMTINSNGFNITIAQPLLSGAANDGGLTKTGLGTLYLTGSNSYLGLTTISSGVLNPANINALDASSGIVFTGGSLQYSSTNTKDYSAKILNSTAPISIDINGQHVTFASGLAASNSGGLTVVNTGPALGTLTLAGANVYSGSTSVGTETVLDLANGGSLPNTAVTVTGSLIAETGNGGIGSGSASLNLGSGSTLSLADGAIGTLTVNGSMTIGGSSAATLNFDINTDANTADTITITGGALNFGAGGGVIFLTDIGATTAPASGTQLTLITDSNGLGAHIFSLGQVTLVIGGQDYALSLANSTSTSEIVTLTSASLNYYWTGKTNSSWGTISNFATDNTGVTAWTGHLSNTSNVFLTADTASNLTQTLDGNDTINSLSFTGNGAGSGSVTLSNGSGTALTINANSPFADAHGTTYSLGTGLVVQAGSAAHTINASIALGNSQTWEIDNAGSNPLTVNGVISDGSTLDSLTKTGSGTLVLNNTETYDGGTIVKGGTLALGPSGSLSSSGTLTVTGTGTFDLAGTSQTFANLADGGVSTGIITSSTGASTLTINNSSPTSYGGAFTDNNAGNGASLSLLLTGSSNVTLSGSSSFTGGTVLQSGNLTVAGNYALGSATSANPNAGLELNPSVSGTVSAFFTSANPAIAALNNPGLGTSNVVLGNTSGTGSATTLNVGAGGGTSTFGGVISDLKTTKATAIGNLTVSGGSLTLTGSNTFTGTTLISPGATLNLGNSLALQNSTLSTNGGGTVNFGILTAVSLGGLTGSADLALINASLGPVNLTIGNNNTTSTYTGSLTGSGNLFENTGTGVITLTNDNMTGNLTVGQAAVTGGTSGALTIAGGTFGSSASTLTIAADGDGAALNISGGTATFGTVNVDPAANETGGGMEVTGSGNAIFSAVNIGSALNTAGNLTINSTGSVSLGTVTVVRDNGGLTNGLIVAGGTATATSVIVQGNSTHVANLNITGGSLVIGNSSSSGALQVGTAGAGATLAMTGGSLTYTGSDGLLLSPTAGITGVATISGTSTVATLTGITVNAGNSAVVTSQLTVSGTSTLYLGGVGLVVNQPGATVTAAFGTSTIGAIAPWTSVAPISLTGTTNFRAADSNNVANNITLGGVLSGAGNLAASGAGTVTLAGANTYTGATAVKTGGTLIVSGSLSGTTGATVSSGGNLEVDGLLNGSISAAVSGKLSGNGTIGGAAVTGGTLAPGLTAANNSSAAGTLTASKNISLDSTSTLSIRLGLSTGAPSDPSTGLGGDVDQLFMNGGTFTLNNTALQLLPGSDLSLGGIYVIVNAGASATGIGSDVFAGIPASGDSYTAANGSVFDIFYGVNAGNTGPGNDIAVEFVSIPEPGSWPMMLEAMGGLYLWQRLRRKSCSRTSQIAGREHP